ncbi:MAG TPA: hypothetical protein VIN08_00735 [Ohtaekwangia sp.]|uniref:hypothetical protein n=1 Tax=Ohtaekwangia sp. TaxID=2066019 RepID=UPI002F9232E2
MRTSLNDIALAERYIAGKLSPEDALVFQARLLTEPLLRWNVAALRKVYIVVKGYHRKKIREEAAAVHRARFNDPAHAAFQQQIYQLFQ